MITMEYVDFGTKCERLVNAIGDTGIFTKVEADESNNISCYSGDTLVLKMVKQDTEAAEIYFYSDEASGFIGNNSGYKNCVVNRIIKVGNKGFVLGSNKSGYNVFVGKTKNLKDGTNAVGCVFCGSSNISSGTKYYSCGKSSTSISTSLPIPASTGDFTILTNAYTVSGLEYFPDIFITTISENKATGRITINGREGFTNGMVTLFDE